MSCDGNDNELKLTQEYKYLLSYIRPLVDQLEKSRDAQLCLLWLSKLEQCSSWERNYRNKILSELCKQVKSNCLKPPFNVAPSSGPLRNVVIGGRKARDWITQICSGVDASTEDVLSTSSDQSYLPGKNSPKHKVLYGVGKGSSFLNNYKGKNGKVSRESVDHSECVAIQKAYHERAQSDQMVIEKYQDIIKSLVSQQLKADISPNRLKKLISSYEIKLAEMSHFLKKTQEENEILKRKIESFAGNGDNLDNLKIDNENLQKKILELENEKNSFENKCQEIEKDKLLALENLIKKLNESENHIKECEKRFKNLERNHEQTYRNMQSEYEAKINEKEKMHSNEISRLENIIQEKQFEIDRLKEEISNQKTDFEQEISNLKHLEEKFNFGGEKKKHSSHKTYLDLLVNPVRFSICLPTLKLFMSEHTESYQMVKASDKINLSTAYDSDNYCRFLKSSVNNIKIFLKIKNLKMKAKKLEKMREHMAVLFQSQLQHILAKKDFYIASLEMQLKMNSSESGGNIYSSDFHNSLDQKISELEAQYRKLLEDSEQQAIQRRQQDLQKIHSLEKQLLSFGGGIVNHDNQIKATLTYDSAFIVNDNICDSSHSTIN